MVGWQLSRLCSGILLTLLLLAACTPASSPAPAATQPPAKPAEAAKPADSKPAEAAKPAAPAAAPAATTAPAAPAAAAKPGAVKLSFIGVQSDDQQFALTAVLAEYQKQHPEIDVDFELLP